MVSRSTSGEQGVCALVSRFVFRPKTANPSCCKIVAGFQTSCNSSSGILGCNAREPVHRTFALSRSTLLQHMHCNFPRYAATSNSGKRSFTMATSAYLRLIRFDKPIGTWLLAFPASWGVALAAQPGSLPDWKMMGVMVTGAFVTRSAGCIINDYWDQDFDRQVERTKQRPIASGEVSNFQALTYFAINGGVALSLLFTQLNTYSQLLSLSSVTLIITYPLFKRFTHWPQVMLGFSFTWGMLVGYSSVAGHCDWSVLLPIYASGVAWTLIYDTIYAFQDLKDDQKAGVKSTTMLFGDKAKPILTGFAILMMSGVLTTGMLDNQTWPYYTAATLASIHLAWQIGTVKLDTPSDCLAKFKANKWLGLIILAGITLGNLVK